MSATPCSHLSDAVIAVAIQKVNFFESRRKSFIRNSSRFVCVNCDFRGPLADLKDGKCTDGNHTCCVSVMNPVELYCLICNDYQFSSRFDESVGRVRPQTLISQIMSETDSMSETLETLRCGQSRRGIVNMGATCFMSSILQILLHNPRVVSSKHLRFSYGTCQRWIKEEKDNVAKKLLLESSSQTVKTKLKGGKAAVSCATTAGCVCCEFKKLIEETAS